MTSCTKTQMSTSGSSSRERPLPLKWVIKSRLSPWCVPHPDLQGPRAVHPILLRPHDQCTHGPALSRRLGYILAPREARGVPFPYLYCRSGRASAAALARARSRL